MGNSVAVVLSSSKWQPATAVEVLAFTENKEKQGMGGKKRKYLRISETDEAFHFQSLTGHHSLIIIIIILLLGSVLRFLGTCVSRVPPNLFGWWSVLIIPFHVGHRVAWAKKGKKEK